VEALQAIDLVQQEQAGTGKPFGIIVAGHNGSGKSTMWRDWVSDQLQIPLINADRMMLSILPEPDEDNHLVPWASKLRDEDTRWMRVAQKGVQGFVGEAMIAGVPFAMETVFSHWEMRPDGTVASKLDLIENLRAAGYFVLLLFVGLPSATYSIARVRSRVQAGGHAVASDRLLERFPRTQKAIAAALSKVDASILMDNSFGPEDAFRVCRVQVQDRCLYDIREEAEMPPEEISAWLDVISPRAAHRA
jgi:predicted ABC-type ATPase